MFFKMILEYFNRLNDENAMFKEFEHGGSLLVDNNDSIEQKGEYIVIKSTTGEYFTRCKNVAGLKLVNREDLIKKVILNELSERLGD